MINLKLQKFVCRRKRVDIFMRFWQRYASVLINTLDFRKSASAQDSFVNDEGFLIFEESEISDLIDFTQTEKYLFLQRLPKVFIFLHELLLEYILYNSVLGRPGTSLQATFHF